MELIWQADIEKVQEGQKVDITTGFIVVALMNYVG
jgi:hypothetical protein